MAPLLETKLHMPPRAGSRIDRPRLDQRFGLGGDASLVVVSAPAGFGKTTAVVEWLDSLPPDRSPAWLSLDEGDNDAVTFWTYVVAALRSSLGDGFGAGASTLLESQAPVDVVMAALLNELMTVTARVVVVLDDYHLIESPEVHQSVAFLLDRLPSSIELVISTRADPPLPLGRLRASGRLVEVRAADLRFTDDETAAYIEGAAGTSISAADVAALAERTEGWAAALQLAALSMRGRHDVSSFIAEFAGDDRYIVDYLAEEVLDRQTDAVRDFLLQTSVLDRLTGPLCDAVSGQTGGKATLERLERANMFLVPLDDRRQQYRYHHLFADVLRAHLADDRPDEVAGLHGRASAWFADHGEVEEAIRHALAGGDVTRAAELVEEALPTWRRNRQETTLGTWLQRLPEEVIRARPVLLVGRVGSRAAAGEFGDDGNAQLDEAERLLAEMGDDVVGDEAQVRSLPASIEMFRAALDLTRGDLDGTGRHGRRALAIAMEDDHLVRGAAAALVGLAAWPRGDLDGAAEAYSESIDQLRRAGHLADVLGCSITLADIRLAQGRLGEFMTVFTDAFDLTTGQGGAPMRGTADVHVGLSQGHRERGDLDAALDHLQRSAALGDHNGLPQHPYRSRLAMARLLDAQGDLAGALAQLEEAERVYMTDFSPSIRPIPAVRAGMLAEHGQVEDALGWVGDRGLTVDDDLDYLTEFEHITLARVWVAQGRADRSAVALDEPVRLLDRLLASALAGGRNRAVMQCLVLRALAEEVRGDRAAALDHLGQAVAMAEPECYVRLFLDEGPAIRSLLAALADGGVSADYIGRVLGTAPEPAPTRRATQPLVDPLSERELDVLRLLNSELTGPEIARELMVSLNTMRTHTKSIYSKLAVTNRRAAVRRADELRLLSHRPPG